MCVFAPIVPISGHANGGEFRARTIRLNGMDSQIKLDLCDMIIISDAEFSNPNDPEQRKISK